jgi:hypothetical protein
LAPSIGHLEPPAAAFRRRFVGSVVTQPAMREAGELLVSELTSSASPKATRASANHHYFLDQDGRPFLLTGDALQCMDRSPSLYDTDYLFAQRQHQGLIAMWVDIVCGPCSGRRPDHSTHDGIVPLTRRVASRRPTRNLFAGIDGMVKLAPPRGMTLRRRSGTLQAKTTMPAKSRRVSMKEWAP